MRTITTSKGKTYTVISAWAPSVIDGSCGIQLLDARRLPEIAAEFDGLTHIHFSDSQTGEYDFDGYTQLVSIRRKDDVCHLKLMQEAT